MTFKFVNGEVKVDMIDYIKGMLKDFPIKFKKGDTSINLVTTDMFKEDSSKKLSEQEREMFHQMVVQELFACKRAWPDIQPIMAVLCTRVKKPGRNDCKKLVRMMKF